MAQEAHRATHPRIHKKFLREDSFLCEWRTPVTRLVFNFCYVSGTVKGGFDKGRSVPSIILLRATDTTVRSAEMAFPNEARYCKQLEVTLHLTF